MKSLFLFAAGLASCLLFTSCGKDSNPFKWSANEQTMEFAQTAPAGERP